MALLKYSKKKQNKNGETKFSIFSVFKSCFHFPFEQINKVDSK